MLFLWLKSNKVGSRLIRWGLKEASSHFAICFDEQLGKTALVIESRLTTGVRPIWLGDFLATCEIVHALQAPITRGEEREFYRLFSSRLIGRKYDTWAMGYWVYAGLMYRLFGRRLPNRNEWGENELVYCEEILQYMPEYLEEMGVDISDIDLEMTSPEMAYNILKQSPYLREVMP